jgi:ELWxxDGT repeat protein
MFTGVFPAVMDALETRRLMAADLVIDAAGLLPTEAVSAAGVNYFFANNGATGRELWRSDGTAGGTQQVIDLAPGRASTSPAGLFTAGDNVVFLTRVKTDQPPQRAALYTYTVWSSDGTAEGTRAVGEIRNAWQVIGRTINGKLFLGVSGYDVNAKAEFSQLLITDGSQLGTLKTFNQDLVLETSTLISHLHAAGRRVVFGNGEGLWSSDGTVAGTQRLVHGNDFAYGARVIEHGSAVVIVSENYLSVSVIVSDGTPQGTRTQVVPVRGANEGDVVIVNNRVLFTTVTSRGNNIVKTVSSYNLRNGGTQMVYETTGEGSDNWIEINAASDSAAMIRVNSSAGDPTVLLRTDGTRAGTTSVQNVGTGLTEIFKDVVVDGVLYYIQLVRGPSEARAEMIGSLSPDGGVSGTGLGLEDKVELWRTDGTDEGTGKIKDLPLTFADNVDNYFWLSEVRGKIALQHITRRRENGKPDEPFDPSKGDVDQTTIYDPSELAVGREAATARLVNGKLRIAGSASNDVVKIFRLASDPDTLVVRYNGNQRTFPFASVRRINVDLQGGDDAFEIDEGTGGMIRLRTYVLGGEGNDTIIAASAPDTLIGGAGSDRLYGGRANDLINGGTGNDRINAGRGADQVSGGEGRDRISCGTDAVDVLFGVTALEYAFGRDVEGEDFLHNILLD